MRNRLLFSALLVGVLATIPGCASMKATNFAQTKDFFHMVSDEAQKQGAAWYIDVEFSGSPEVYSRTSLGLNTGISATAHISGNAAAGRPSPATLVP